jgi:hypothetical protein
MTPGSMIAFSRENRAATHKMMTTASNPQRIAGTCSVCNRSGPSQGDTANTNPEARTYSASAASINTVWRMIFCAASQLTA